MIAQRARRVARFSSRISIRLLAFNLLLVFLPAAGLLYLGTYERQLLDAQERSMVQQGRLLAASLSGHGGLDAAEAERVLVQLNRRLDARLRVVDEGGRLVVDSAALGPRRDEATDAAGAAAGSVAERGTRDSPLYRLGSWANRWWRALRPAPELPAAEVGLYTASGDDRRLTGVAVREALAGRYGADLRVTPSGPGGRAATILHSAIPVLAGTGDEPGRVVGAVLVSQSTGRTLAALGEVRLGIFRVFLASVAVAVMLTLLASTTIARPLRRLRDRATAIVDRRGRLTGRFQGSEKLDEIGDLARALAALTHRLEQRMRFIEAFAADVSHELKNPLASIRTATEVVAEVDGEADRRRFTGIVLAEVARIERLLTGLREIGSLDALLEDEAAEPVSVSALVAGVVEGYRLRAAGSVTRRGGRPALPVEIDLSLPGEPLATRIAPERLGQVVENLLDNAISFSRNGAGGDSPGGGSPGGVGTPAPPRVRVEVGRDGEAAVLAVSDRGPGIPEDHGERIFDRFFTYRPGEPAGRDGHTGLGLAIVKAIVEGHGGTVRAANRPGGGARFEVRLPLAG